MTSPSGPFRYYLSQRPDDVMERVLSREAQDRCLGTLGDRTGINVAKVEVSWVLEYDDFTIEEHAGHYIVHATGEEQLIKDQPEEEQTIYIVFETLVAEAMDAKLEAGEFDSWNIDDISAA